MSESLSEKIAGILTTAPTSFDPEDDIYVETVARVESGNVDEAESDDEVNLTNFRKQNVDLLEDFDKRYEGLPSSRKNLLDSDDDQFEEGSLHDYEESGNEVDSIDEEAESDADIDGSSENENIDEDMKNDEQFKHLKDSDVSEQIKKGTCVRQQLSMWESFLEIRIQMQKCLLTANKLPQTDTVKDLTDKCGLQYKNIVAESEKSVKGLLDKFLLLQSLLLKKYPETKKLSYREDPVTIEQTKHESDEEIPSDTDEEQSTVTSEDAVEVEIQRKKRKINNYSTEIDRRHRMYKDYRNSVIQKWNDKTRIAVSKSGNLVHSVTNQIEHILSDKQKLIKRTQLKRADYEIIGQKTEDTSGNNLESSEEYDVNIFDDTDFYHHLLRELIEFKSADLTDPVQLGRQWLQLQSLRSKMKRKIDTKATKGRKIRYVVHSKLVNFMAPIDEGSWQEEAKSELYSSLFGKNQQQIYSV